MKENTCFLGENVPYLRPYLCRGEFHTARIILAGINPATPIYPSDMSIRQYEALLSDYPSFMEFYKEQRLKENKTAVSRTRQGILSFVEWVEKELGEDVIESDVCTYPTKSLRELDKIEKRFRAAGREMFWDVLCKSHAEILLLYGMRAFRDFVMLLREKKVEHRIVDRRYREEDLCCMDIKKLEEVSPVSYITIGNREVMIYAVRHFMYYGKNGASYHDVKKKLQEQINLYKEGEHTYEL